MTQEAIGNGIYMRPLSKRESLVVMANVVAEHYSGQPDYVIPISELLLEYDPHFVPAMLHIANAYSIQVKHKFVSKYKTPKDIPLEQRSEFLRLAAANRTWFEKAEKLGWREPSREDEGRYQQLVRRAAGGQP